MPHLYLRGAIVNNSNTKKSFSKPWLSYDAQITLLQNRGLIIDDKAKAWKFISHINYYRFSGYCLAFETERHTLKEGTTFDQICEAYRFDTTLRDLLFEAVEAIELDFRTIIAHSFGENPGPFGYTDASSFDPRFSHMTWLERLEEEVERSRELFVSQFKHKYTEYPLLPIWMMMEIMSFSNLSLMYKNLLRDYQKPIANRYKLQPRTLKSWIHHIVYIRNLCAHHSRIWDRDWKIKPNLPPANHWNPPLISNNSSLFVTLLILKKMMDCVPAIRNSFVQDWKTRIMQHIDNPPPVSNANERMGLTVNWKAHPIWRN
ncbi:MAG: hypothetical protein COA78_06685 [Blastopirellula sp.]|nr:MAG: hypothetical protein COA78_06685 [Blastopirellula sp.]